MRYRGPILPPRSFELDRDPMTLVRTPSRDEIPIPAHDRLIVERHSH